MVSAQRNLIFNSLRTLGIGLMTIGLFACTIKIRTPPQTSANQASSECAGVPYESGSGTSIDPYLICSAAQFSRIGDQPNATFQLTANIELSSATTIPSFSGTLDGADFVIRSFVTSTCLITSASNATIRNMVIDQFTVVNSGSGSSPTSFLICTGQNLTLENLTIQDSRADLNLYHFGGFVGDADGSTFNYLSIANVSVVSAMSVSALAGGTCNSCTVSNYSLSNVDLEGTSSATGGLHVANSSLITDSALAGLTIANSGRGAGIVDDVSETLIKNVIITGLTITNSAEAGGIAVYSVNSEIVGVNINGAIDALNESGGIVSTTAGNDFLQCTNQASVSTTGSNGKAGGIVADSEGGGSINRFIQVTNTGNITAAGGGFSTAGGIIGDSIGFNLITRSRNSGTITSAGNAGGLVGKRDVTSAIGELKFVIINSLNEGQVIAPHLAGFIGYSTDVATQVALSFSTGILTGGSPEGLIGGTAAATYAAYFDSTNAGTTSSSGGGTAKTTSELSRAETFFNYEQEHFWNVVDGSTPTLRIRDFVTNHVRCNPTGAISGSGIVSDPYLVCSPEQLQAFSSAPGVYAKLNRDLFNFGVVGPISIDGVFDGDYFLWSGKPSGGQTYYIQGMNDSTAVLRNMHFDGIIDSIPINQFDDGSIDNITTSGTRNGVEAGLISQMGGDGGELSSVRVFVEATNVDRRFGGVVSIASPNSGVNLQNIYVNLNLVDSSFSPSSAMGGIIGEIDTGSNTFDKIFTEGIIDVPNKPTLGGLIGATGGVNVITRSVSNTDLIGAENVGGAIAIGGGTIDDSYFTGQIESRSTSARLGGIIGRGGAVMSRVFFGGEVSAPNNTSGYADAISEPGSGGTYADCFYDATKNPGGSASTCVGRTTGQMNLQATFTNFDFTNIWIPPSSTYPTLR